MSLNKPRSIDTFFDVYLGSNKASTKKQYHFALQDFEIYTKRVHNMNLQQIVNVFKESQVEDILDVLQAWINQSNIELRNKRFRTALVNTFLYYMGVKIDPRDLKTLKYGQGEPEERYAIPLETIKKIIYYVKPKQRALYLTLLSSGMAIGEACHVRLSDIDFTQTRPRIYLKASYTKRNGRSRIVFLSREAQSALEPMLESKGENDYIFHDSLPEKAKESEITTFRRHVDDLKLGKKYESGTRMVTLHGLRAYFFTQANQKHGLSYAHKMTGHKGYLEEYNRYSEDKKLEMYLELEPYLLVASDIKLKLENDQLKQKIMENNVLKLDMEKVKQRLEIS